MKLKHCHVALPPTHEASSLRQELGEKEGDTYERKTKAEARTGAA